MGGFQQDIVQGIQLKQNPLFVPTAKMQGADSHCFAVGIQQDQPGNYAGGGCPHQEDIDFILEVQTENAVEKKPERIAEEE
jgi:hypothetical protein